MNRAYSVLTVKAVRDDERIIRGVATTPTPDRVGDIVEPLGVTFKGETLPLLWQHEHDKPVGRVKFDKPTKEGINFEARLPKIDEPGTLKDRVDEAWQSVKAGLVAGVSIGFRVLEDGYERMKSGGLRFTKTEVMELSLVTIPANADATISLIKQFDVNAPAATGHQRDDDDVRPGASGKSTATAILERPRSKMTTLTRSLSEQIAALEAKRAANAARMEEIMLKALDEGHTLDAEQQEEFDTLEAEVKAVDGDIKRLKSMEALKIATAKPVQAAADGTVQRQVSRIEVRGHNVPKGIGFTRYVSALAQAQGDRREAAEIAKQWAHSSPEVEAILRLPKDVIAKTAVNPGTTTDTTWAAPLVQYTNLASEFVDYLRPLTIMGRIQGFRRVPFKVKVPRQTAGATVNWVGEGKVKPLTSIAFDSITLDHFKVAGIIPVTDELIRLSSPSAEMLVRDDLAAAIAQFLDVEFLDISNASTDVSPASITYGVTPTYVTGTTADAFRADVGTMMDALLTANQQVQGGVWIMTQSQALKLALMRNSLGQAEFPGMSVDGGTLLGFPVITSQNITAYTASPADGYPIYFILPGEVLMADEGGVMVDISREASVQMETAPDSPFTASTTLVSLWQHNLVGIRVERYINWKVRRSTACGVIQGAKYSEA